MMYAWCKLKNIAVVADIIPAEYVYHRSQYIDVVAVLPNDCIRIGGGASIEWCNMYCRECIK